MKKNRRQPFGRFAWTGAVWAAVLGLAAGCASTPNRAGVHAPLPLKIVGTKILNGRGEPVLLHGVNAASMEWSSDGQGHILQTVNTAIHDWHANIIRLPLTQDRCSR